MSTSTKIRITRTDVIAAAIVIACAAGLGTWIAALADEQSVVDSRSTIGPCVQEDSDNCYWMAEDRSNGRGRSFVTIDGVTTYLGHR